jgi:hypothetical protein
VTFQDIAPEHTGYFASEVTKWKSGNAIKARHSFSEFRQTIRPDMKWNWMTDVVTELQGFYNAFAAGKRPKLAIGHMEGPAPKKPVKTTGQISANGCTPAGINPPETGCRRDRTAWPMGLCSRRRIMHGRARAAAVCQSIRTGSPGWSHHDARRCKHDDGGTALCQQFHEPIHPDVARLVAVSVTAA